MVTESEILATDGRRLHVYDTGEHDRPVVYWHHGAGMVGTPPPPFVALAQSLGLRIVAHDRPGYGSSSPHAGRSVADGVLDAVSVLDHLGVRTAAAIGLSAGGMHSLGCAALHPARFAASVTLCGPAPYPAAGLDWFDGMAPANRAEFEVALSGREALAAYLSAQHDVDLGMFAPADLAAMRGPYWDWQLAAATASTEGPIEDELACLADWGFDLADIRTPTLVVHGAEDGFVPSGHARWVAEAIPGSTLRIEPGGHISTIPAGEDALPWLRSHLG